MRLNIVKDGIKVQVPVHSVSVPFIQAFAAKENNEWFIYEYFSGLKVTIEPGKSKDEAVRLALSRLDNYDESSVMEYLKNTIKINQ